MSTFLFVILGLYLYGLVVSYERDFKEPIKTFVGAMLITATAVAQVWVAGWLMLPSWGIGSIHTCFGS